MSIQTQTFTQIVQNAVTAIQGGAAQLVDLTVGSILRAFVEATAAIVLWLQGIALQIAALTRFASSSGADADSWAADYGFTRLPAQAATGAVTFARFTPTMQAMIPVGTLVQTADGSQQYQVVADTTPPSYSPALQAYVIAAGAASCTASVVAVNAAAASNASAGMVNTLSGAIPYVDTVTNALGYTNGADAESDAAFRTRFVAWVASLSKATRGAIGNALLSLQQGVSYSITENYLYNGTPSQGHFYVVVDDGTGTPGSTFLSSASNAVDAVRPVGSTFDVHAPVVVSANVAMVLSTASGYDHTATVALVVAALTAYINSLTIGTTLAYSRLAQVAHDASPGVLSATGVTLNSGTADLTATSQQVIKVGTLNIT
ncbi:MAG: baseplate protein [Betaproteobacteria bacterium HGW-Betaproteobacteria-18]|jgi:uncharacterized phage protein gp47/JayE|nr:MAG: baseplate protein [Deltaproteobacteria bacterium HGW-Deltaproteobacteria-8]PKO59711.1 MAG: baseplate protein [Betaproteobacteria bacterium HGW-Betaproteobacteria-18]